MNRRSQDTVQRALAERIRTEGHARARLNAVPASSNDLVSAAAFIDATRNAVYGGTEYDRQYMDELTPRDTPSQITYGLAERIRILADAIPALEKHVGEVLLERDAALNETESAMAYIASVERDAKSAIDLCLDALHTASLINDALVQELRETTLQRDAFCDEVRYWKGEGVDAPERLDPAGLDLFMRDLCAEVDAAVREGREVNFGTDIEFVFVEGGTKGLSVDQFSDVMLLLKSINPSGTRVA